MINVAVRKRLGFQENKISREWMFVRLELARWVEA